MTCIFPLITVLNDFYAKLLRDRLGGPHDVGTDGI